MVMKTTVSKSEFKARALEYLRRIERTGRELIVTDRGRPAVKIIPYVEDPDEAYAALRDTVLRYDAPTEPVGEENWESLQ
ncbi:MAG TPA: type II toxin-antitoxin system Phd/YefM family antitoxin [Acidobacteriota bacterium]|nr:type II toxin-antitoxin system Phd/YefM family antitoxin [Acidobacteriota bacterium]